MDLSTVTCEAEKVGQLMFECVIHAIGIDMFLTFDSICHTFEGFYELKDPPVIQKACIQLWLTEGDGRKIN